jgi:hypothetical protein
VAIYSIATHILHCISDCLQLAYVVANNNSRKDNGRCFYNTLPRHTLLQHATIIVATQQNCVMQYPIASAVLAMPPNALILLHFLDIATKMGLLQCFFKVVLGTNPCSGHNSL